ncbi:MAG: hypothetical protein NTW95_01525 [Candidatus Aminicenantes bacterium]|nr:hypothetical protein [Candidatus Aminicenantes bacterium]
MKKSQNDFTWRWNGAYRYSGLWLGVAIATCIVLNLAWEKNQSRLPEASVRTFEQPSGTAVKLSDRAYQRLGEKSGILFCEYGFFNFNSDFLKINYQIPRQALEEYRADYGYDDAEFRRLDAEHQRSYDNAVDFANNHRLSQTQLDALIRNIDRQYKINLNIYMASRCFKILKGNIAQVDMPDLVRRNIPRLQKVANAFDRIAGQGHYDTMTTIGAATSFVQLAMRYEIPPKVRGGRNTGGILPPLEALMSGWGDCDTKTALLASILGNWELVRMVGIALPHHYLMAIRCSPNKGDMYVRFQGVDYVLIDPAGPAWLPPGQVSSNSYDSLQDDEGYVIEPFF